MKKNNHHKTLQTSLGSIAYNKFSSTKENNICVIFLGGWHSDMQGSKALFLENLCQNLDISFIRFDYLAHGKSEGNIMDFSINAWKQNALDVIDNITDNEQIILIGSSMGGWISVLSYLERKNRIKSLIGIASAPDFTENLVWKGLPADAKLEIEQQGFWKMPADYCDDPAGDFSYIISKRLIDEGRQNLVLTNDSIGIDCPVTLLHGMKDNDVPYQYSLMLKNKLLSANVEVLLLENSSHRMSSEFDLLQLEAVLRKHLEGFI